MSKEPDDFQARLEEEDLVKADLDQAIFGLEIEEEADEEVKSGERKSKSRSSGELVVENTDEEFIRSDFINQSQTNL